MLHVAKDLVQADSEIVCVLFWCIIYMEFYDLNLKTSIKADEEMLIMYHLFKTSKDFCKENKRLGSKKTDGCKQCPLAVM